MTKTAGSRVREERDRFVAFAFAAADLLIEIDRAGVVQFASGAVTGLTSSSADDLSGRSLLDIVMPADREIAKQLLGTLSRGNRINPVRLHLKSGNGKSVPTMMGGTRLPQVPDRAYLTFTSAPALASTANGHGAAGMLDHTEFVDAAKARLAKAAAAGVDEDLTFMVIDGLAAMRESGDPQAIETFLDKLGAHLRTHSADGATAGELADERFAVVPGAGVTEADLQAGVQELIDAQGDDTKDLAVKTFSVDLDVTDLSEADTVRALVYSIDKFTNAVGSDFSISSLAEGAQAILDETLPRVQELRDTIDDRAFDMVYQPIVDLHRNKVHHYEALTRLTGLRTPGELIAFAEQLGVVTDFDLAVCQKVLEALDSHSRSGWKPQVAVNLSALSMQNNLFIDELFQVVGPFEDCRKQLMFELTETVRVDDFGRLNRAIQRFRGDGHQVSLDDVGAGSTSFESLHRLEVDFVKIDGTHVRHAATDDRHLSILKSIIEACKGLNVEIIAEQIEGEKEAAIMRDLGIKFGQGYHFGRPVMDFSQRFVEPVKRPPSTRKVGKRRGATVTWQ